MIHIFRSHRTYIAENKFFKWIIYFSICVTVVVLNVHFRTPQTHTMAPWVRRLIFLYVIISKNILESLSETLFRFLFCNIRFFPFIQFLFLLIPSASRFLSPSLPFSFSTKWQPLFCFARFLFLPYTGDQPPSLFPRPPFFPSPHIPLLSSLIPSFLSLPNFSWLIYLENYFLSFVYFQLKTSKSVFQKCKTRLY